MKMPPKQASATHLKTASHEVANGFAPISVYAAGLSGEHQRRYLEKISVINRDSYLLQMDIHQLPTTVSYEAIIDYVFHRQSAYSRSDFHCFKALEAKRRFESGMVQSVEGVQLANMNVVRAKVMHSMSVNDRCLTPWIIVEGEKILSAHCDCIAGIGEVCSHVGAVLYHLTHLNHCQLVNGNISVTDKEQSWGRPNSSIVGNLQQPLDNIDFGYQRATFDPMLKDHELRAKLKMLQDDGIQCTAMQSFCFPAHECARCQKVNQASEFKDLLLNSLYRENYRGKTIEQLRFIALSIYESQKLTIDEKVRQQVEESTRGQSKDHCWKLMRIGRITASTLKTVLGTNITKPSISLLNTICYPDLSYFSTQATRYGKKMENVALGQLRGIVLKCHQLQASFQQSGLLIHKEFHELAASPDALLCCTCCGNVPIEIKCPFNFKDDDDIFTRLTKSKSPYIAKIENGYELVQSHQYYAQIQMQIAITGSEYGYFYIWTKRNSLLLQVEKNERFWREAQPKASSFFIAIILPELHAKYFTSIGRR